METNLKQITDFISKQNNVENEKSFKVASATLVCSIIDIVHNNPEKFSSLFQKSFDLAKDEFYQIKTEIENNGLTIDDKILYIKKEFNNNMFQIMQFLKILNKFAILDGCTQKNYNEFETIRDKFLKTV